VRMSESHLVQLMEECAEVIQAASKYLRFGKYNFDPNDDNSKYNCEHLRNEILDLYTVIRVLELNNMIESIDHNDTHAAYLARYQKIKDTKALSKSLGCITGENF